MNRKLAKRGTTRFERVAPFVGYHLFKDIELAEKLIERGWPAIFEEY